MTLKLISAALLVALSAGYAAAESHEFEITGDAEKGEKTFRKCMACHAVGEDAKNKVGPVLNGIVGRAAGVEAGFSYSAPLMDKAAEGLVWTPDTLAQFLEKPRDFIKGTKMSFAGLRKEAERDDVIAYLATFKSE
ncbi:cytochrome c family protein [Puniceibacterium sp. IMCC21224]|uniref:c-type cytochrome n=1 Tax=Puniceibacterium sp. IMCC21224 TaxID=1618204 RepID=UPI00064DA7DB|nr:cytochrome c family protein [Puniceibacterium sp. IMCC21224]KMK65475.1 cytochrome c2 [Puniceibacterium sp. IMCC21224]